MVLPASGPISLADIADEFLIARNLPFPSAYYGLGGAPGSGPLSFADFYGRRRNSISASKTSLFASGFLAADSALITVVGGTIASVTLVSGSPSARVTLPTVGATSSYLTVTTPGAGNGSIFNTYRVTDSNGNYVDIVVNANWGTD